MNRGSMRWQNEQHYIVTGGGTEFGKAIAIRLALKEPKCRDGTKRR